MGEQLGEGAWQEMKLLLVSLDFNVPGFACPGSLALMLRWVWERGSAFVPYVPWVGSVAETPQIQLGVS